MQSSPIWPSSSIFYNSCHFLSITRDAQYSAVGFSWLYCFLVCLEIPVVIGTTLEKRHKKQNWEIQWNQPGAFLVLPISRGLQIILAWYGNQKNWPSLLLIKSNQYISVRILVGMHEQLVKNKWSSWSSSSPDVQQSIHVEPLDVSTKASCPL